MVQYIEELLETDPQDDLRLFAEYLGIDFEDYLELLHPDVDFDDVSR